MGVLHLWAVAIGSVALAAPIAVHFLTKPQPINFPLSTIRFLTEVIEQRRARSRLRDWLILLLRTLCIGLLALALARPLLNQKPIVPVEATKDAQRLLVIDVSQSMSAGSAGVSSWSAAQAHALSYLEKGSGLQAAVVFAGAKAQPVFDRMSPNLNAIREAIRQAKPKAERVDPRLALETAASILNKASGTTKELVIISDFQRNNWGTMLLDLVPSDTQIQFHSVAPKVTDNVAITAVRFTSDPIIDQPVVLEVEIANNSANPVESRCLIDIASTQRTIDVKVAPQSTRTVTEIFTFNEAGWKNGWARLESNLDVLPSDDERPFAIRVRPPIQLLMVSRQNAQEIPSSSFFLEQAIGFAFGATAATNEAAAKSSPIVRVHPSRDPLRNWPTSDVYVLDHPGSLPTETLQLIASQIRRGKGLLYVTAELADAVNLKQLQELLGGDFQPPVELTVDKEAFDRKDLFVTQARSRDVPFAILGSNNAANVLTPVRFSGGLNTRLAAEGLKDQVLAELSDTSALLYQSSVGAGQIAVLNTDLSRSNWAVQPTFLPIIGELIQSLLASQSQRDQASCGEPVVRLLSSEVSDPSSLSASAIEGPNPEDDRFGKWEWVPTQSAIVWSWDDPSGPGIYALEQNDEPKWMLATAAPAIESDLSSLDEEVLTQRISGTRRVGFASNETENKNTDDVWKWLIIGCLFGLLAEIATLRWNRI
jgi:hypothetical protein